MESLYTRRFPLPLGSRKILTDLFLENSYLVLIKFKRKTCQAHKLQQSAHQVNPLFVNTHEFTKKTEGSFLRNYFPRALSSLMRRDIRPSVHASSAELARQFRDKTPLGLFLLANLGILTNSCFFYKYFRIS